MIPTAILALNALKISVLGKKDRNNGVIKVSAKKPYTIEGMPARSSIIGLITFLTFELANSLRKIAVPKPNGNDTKLDKIAIKSVPVINGNTPNDGGSKTGAHLIEVKNSKIDTSEKKIIVSNKRLNTIPMVVNIDIDANSTRTTSINFS